MCTQNELGRYYNDNYRKGGYNTYDYRDLNHVHDYSGRTELAGERLHDHGFSNATGKGIPVGGGRHVHRYMNRTTFDIGHDHRMTGTTGVDISVQGGKHVHDEKSVTSLDLGHRHGFKFTTSAARKTKRNNYNNSYGYYRDCSY